MAPDLNSPSGVGELRSRQALALYISAAILGFIGLVVVAAAFTGGKSDHHLIGEQAPKVSGVSITGERFDSETVGGYLLVNFFALWCPGCIEEHPELVKLEEWGTDNDLSIVAIVYDSVKLAPIVDFFAEEGGDWPVLDSPTVASAFAVSKLPESFLVADDGTVVAHFVGQVSFEEVVAKVEGRGDE